MNNENMKVPEGWKGVRLGEVSKFFKGRIFLKNDVNNDGEYEFIHYGELFTTYKENIKKVVSHIDNANNAFFSKVNDVLMPTSDVTPSGLATASCIKKDGVILGSDILVIRSKENIEGIYLSHVIRLNKTDILKLTRGTTVYHLYASEMAKFAFLLPPLPEQQKIAEILETVDRAIEKTDKIIEKYKRIKQGLMQDLLTKGVDENGKIRSEKTHKFKNSPLGRIPEEWEIKKLEEIGEIISGSTPNTNITEFWNGNIVWITPEDLSKADKLFLNSSIRKITLLGLKNCSAKIIPANSIVISSRAPIGYIKVITVDFSTNQGCKSISYNGKFNSVYLAYLLTTKTNEMINLGGGTTFQEITKSNLKSLLIPLPPLPEQQRIAEILSQIDNTIEKEEAYKQKLDRIKKGLMEDLLTGRVRVNKLIKEKEV